jgi:hypothetical protein
MTVSNQNLARIAGMGYLMVIATGLFSEVFVRQALRVPGDALATFNNIQTHEMLFRWGFVADLLNFIIGLPVALIIYTLFKKTNRFLCGLALIFIMIQTAIIALNLLNQLYPLLLFPDNGSPLPFSPDQLAALSHISLNLQNQGYAIGLSFFGVACLLMGYVYFSSGRIPKLLGILYAFSGVGYLVNSFTMFLSKGFHNPVFNYVAIPIFIGEFLLTCWLIFKGVRSDEA